MEKLAEKPGPAVAEGGQLELDLGLCERVEGPRVRAVAVGILVLGAALAAGALLRG